MQNTSHAVIAQRVEAADSPDDFPTSPWATRALVERVLEDRAALTTMLCLEPACGAGHMAEVLKEYFHAVTGADAYYYGYVRDFLTYPYEANACDWVITNPPFRLAEEFVLRALRMARRGVAILARTASSKAVDGIGLSSQLRHQASSLWGRLDGNATTATGYAWLV
jgi:hypothetical protein